METKELTKLPTLTDLINQDEQYYKDNAFMVLLNQEPPAKWLQAHPIATTKNAKGDKVPVMFLPIERVEYLLTRIFTKWSVEIRSTSVMANSVAVTIRLTVRNPVTGEQEWNDGVGAAPIQTDQGKGAMDWNFAKSTGVQIALPAAESYAIKDAAEKFGKIFGKDLNRKDGMIYDNLYQQKSTVTFEDLQFLFDLKKPVLTPDEITSAERIINNKEINSYSKLHKILSEK